VLADEERFGNLDIRPTAPDETEDLTFTFAQGGEAGRRRDRC
jgi:hypothetical protein